MTTIVLVTPDLRHDYMAVRWDVFVTEQNVPPVFEIDARDFTPDVLHLAAYSDTSDTMVGAMRLIPTSPHNYRLGRLAVRREARGKGIGARLVDTAHTIVRNHLPAGHCATITLEAQYHARHFYEKLGYTATNDKLIMDAGIAHIEMAIKLDRP